VHKVVEIGFWTNIYSKSVTEIKIIKKSYFGNHCTTEMCCHTYENYSIYIFSWEKVVVISDLYKAVYKFQATSTETPYMT
jgi:hypothetical protein